VTEGDVQTTVLTKRGTAAEALGMLAKALTATTLAPASADTHRVTGLRDVKIMEVDPFEADSTWVCAIRGKVVGSVFQSQCNTIFGTRCVCALPE
jgi:hypothetical protein